MDEVKDENLKHSTYIALNFSKLPHFIPSVFFPFWRENFLMGPGRKHLGLTIYFPSSPPNQTYGLFMNVQIDSKPKK